MPEEIKDPQQDNPQKPTEQQDSSQKEQSNNNSHIETIDDLPEKFKGKSASDIAKSYLELEKRINDANQAIKDKDAFAKEVEQWRQLGQVIQSDPELTAAIKKKVGNQESETKAPDDTRDALTNNIVNNFEKEYAIDKLSPEKREVLYAAIGKELADMLDPSGKKSTKEILDSINLTRLPTYLSKAYRLATIEDEAEQARLKGLMQAKQNSDASFPGITSSGSKSNSDSLTEDERAVAKKLGISEEKYLEQKKKLN